MKNWIVGCLVIAGCEAPADLPDDTGESVVEDSALPDYVFQPEDPELPSIEEIRIGIAKIIEEIPKMDTLPVFTGYDAIRVYESPQCPEWVISDHQESWRHVDTGCETPSGTRFQGKMLFNTEIDIYRESYAKNTMNDMRVMFGLTDEAGLWIDRQEKFESTIATGHVEFTDGTVWEASGDFHRYFVSWGGLVLDTHEIAGIYTPTTTHSLQPWVERAWKPNITMLHITTDTAEKHHREVNGSIAGITGPISAIEFLEVSIAHQAVWGGCPLEPHGVISVRSELGHWIDVTFDGSVYPPDGTLFGDECDRCGVATYGAEELGTVCVDFEPLLADYQPTGSE